MEPVLPVRQTAKPWLPPLTWALLLGLAALFRLSDLGGRNLWTDEAWVALAVLKPTVAEALAAGQSTPPLYLLTVRLLAQIFGGSEVVLRAFSCALGLGTVLLFWPLARRLTSPAAAWLGLAAVSCSPVLVYFSKELKQYSGDAFFAVLVALLGERFLERPGPGRLALLAAAGAAGLGFSHPLIFVLPAVGLAAFVGAPAWRRWLVAVAGLWAVSFLGYYLAFFRHQVNPELISYWQGEFPDFSGVWAFLAWLAGALTRYFQYFFGEHGAWWAPAALAAGWWAVRPPTRSRLLLYLGAPLLLAFIAAALHRYPFMARYGGCRLLLFSAPFLYLGVAAGVALLLSRVREWRRGAAVALALLLVLSLHPLRVIQENLHPTWQRRQITPLLVRLEREFGPRDLLYVYYYAIYPFRYYRPEFPPAQVRVGTSVHETRLFPGDEDEDDEDEDTPHRVWLLAAHYPEGDFLDTFAARLLGPRWRLTARYQEPGAALMCFERHARLTARPAPGPP